MVPGLCLPFFFSSDVDTVRDGIEENLLYSAQFTEQ